MSKLLQSVDDVSFPDWKLNYLGKAPRALYLGVCSSLNFPEFVILFYGFKMSKSLARILNSRNHCLRLLKYLHSLRHQNLRKNHALIFPIAGNLLKLIEVPKLFGHLDKL